MPRLIANSVLKKLLIALAGLAFLPAALAGSFCSAVLPGLCVSGKLTNGLADVTITAPPGIWWLAFSIGSTMPGADLMVFFPPSAASSVLLASDRHAKGFSTPLIDSRNDIVLQADSVRHSNGSMVIHFTRALSTGDAGDRDFQTGKQGYGWAWRYAPVPTQQMNSDMDLSVHDATEGMEFELLPAGAAGGGSIPVATPGAETLDQYNKILVAHGAVMFLAWVGLAPVGAWMVRYRRGKPSFAVHVSCLRLDF